MKINRKLTKSFTFTVSFFSLLFIPTAPLTNNYSNLYTIGDVSATYSTSVTSFMSPQSAIVTSDDKLILFQQGGAADIQYEIWDQEGNEIQDVQTLNTGYTGSNGVTTWFVDELSDGNFVVYQGLTNGDQYISIYDSTFTTQLASTTISSSITDTENIYSAELVGDQLYLGGKDEIIILDYTNLTATPTILTPSSNNTRYEYAFETNDGNVIFFGPSLVTSTDWGLEISTATNTQIELKQITQVPSSFATTEVVQTPDGNYLYFGYTTTGSPDVKTYLFDDNFNLLNQDTASIVTGSTTSDIITLSNGNIFAMMGNDMLIIDQQGNIDQEIMDNTAVGTIDILVENNEEDIIAVDLSKYSIIDGGTSSIVVPPVATPNSLTNVSEPTFNTVNQTATFQLTFNEQLVSPDIDISIDNTNWINTTTTATPNPNVFNVTFSTASIDLNQSYTISWRVDGINQNLQTEFIPDISVDSTTLESVSNPTFNLTNETVSYTLTFSTNVDSPDVDVSIDDGITWQQGTVTGSEDTYIVEFSTANIDLEQSYTLTWRINNTEQTVQTEFTPDIPSEGGSSGNESTGMPGWMIGIIITVSISGGLILIAFIYKLIKK